MKSSLKILFGSLLLLGLQFAFTGCETDGSVSGDVYYGPDYREPWFRDDVWMDGTRGYHEGHEYHHGEDVYINPPRVRLPSAPHIPTPARPRL